MDQELKYNLYKIMLLNQKLLRPFETKIVHDVTLLQFRTLCILDDSGPLTVNELAKIQLISKQQISLLMKGLVEKGYVNKQSNHGDKRSYQFVITTKGTSLLQSQLALVIEMIISKINTLQDDKKEKMIESIDYISKTMEELL